ncbi:enoyl-CoA hydratase/isomerase family protein [Streptomyces sp. NBC_00059]|uniref:enoyl-CoA hydratase/isomerase family protein n=1 Tax=Streptomyces sp. NBC_00059 TaxID=2975635 RepID=UPI00224EF841|nr:enoyl-CoA hydratase/isomerase family protein [Streptomyces sp. NBC_00059]MCX5415773.1 enoyl-CoA hydratase/isomerase family protein [Streptomyces sp. NBC_00059]
MRQGTEFGGSITADRKELENELGPLQEALDNLPDKPDRSAGQQQTAGDHLSAARKLRRRFMRCHADAVYEELTDGGTRSPRLTELARLASERFPQLVPDPPRLKQDAAGLQRHKDGLEIDLGIFYAELLRHPRSGSHLVRSMTEPVPEALLRMGEFHSTGTVDLGPVAVHRDGSIGVVTFQNRRFINAEDNDTATALEIAVDLVLLDDSIEVGILRGAVMDHPKWAGQRIFGAGINLSALYEGGISLVDFFLNRELGALHKIFRGHPLDDETDDLSERREKPWISVIDNFAIGGGCQMLLVTDRVVADETSYFNLPAGREGIVPGCGVLRLPRFLGEGLSRQTIFGSRDIASDSPEGRLLVSDIAPGGEALDAAVQRAADDFLACGAVGVRANRRALRVGCEPLDTFRRYMAAYALDQAVCIHSKEVIANLERTWGDKLVARTATKGTPS